MKVGGDHEDDDDPVPPCIGDIEAVNPKQFEQACQANVNPIFLHSENPFLLIIMTDNQSFLE